MQNHQQENPAGMTPPGIFLASRYPDYKHWAPVGYLTREPVAPNGSPGRYIFSYVEAARKNKLPPLWSFVEPKPSDWEALYASDEFPTPFSWRIRNESRPDYATYMSALGLTREEVRQNPFALLARTEGRKVTDWYETFAKPIPQGGRYDIPFFLRGLHHFMGSGKERFNSVVNRVKALQPDEELLLMLDSQNPADPDAVSVRTADRMLVGYCPRYLAREFRCFLDKGGPTGGNLKVRVQQVNPDGSLSLMLLCRLTCDAVSGFAPCEGSEFKILSPKMRELAAA